MSDKVSALKDALKKSRMKEIMDMFGKKDHEMVGEGSSPKEAMDDLHEVHGETSDDTCPMCHGGTPMAKGGVLKARDSDVDSSDNATQQGTRTTAAPLFSDPVEKTHALDRQVGKIGTPTKGLAMPEDDMPMLSEGGITVEDEDTVPTLNDESGNEEDDEPDQRLGNQADVDDIPAIQALRRRNKNKKV